MGLEAGLGFMFSHRSMSVESPVSLLPKERVRKRTPFGRWELVSQVPRNAGIYLTTRNLRVQFDLISGYRVYLLEFWELEFISFEPDS